jgi:RNA polymerase sigma-70 factor (ECF subfamily)
MIRSEQRVARLAWRILGDAEEVREALQDTFYRVFRSLRGFDERQDFFAWIYRIAVNVCRDLDRRRRRRHFFFVPFDQHIDLPDRRESSMEEREQLDLVARAIERLPLKERTALVLHDIEALPTETVAQILGSSASTVRVQISSARAKLRKWVQR